ncbi:MAG: GNAT family N-acetyltransferase [Devosiaceae bacterium]
MGLFPLTLRPATSSDLDRLIEVGSAACINFLSDQPGCEQAPQTVPDAVKSWLAGGVESVLVAQSESAILGWARTVPESGEIEDLWVEPRVHGHGIGAMLLAAAEAQVKATGHSCAWLTTHAQKNATLRFYRTHGYALLNISQAKTESVPGLVYDKATLGKQLSRPNAVKATSMTDVRVGIDTLDPILVSLIAERFAFIDRAADLKPLLAMPARVENRVEEVVQNARMAASNIGFDADLTESLWRVMIDIAIAREESKMGPDRARALDESAA